MKEAKVDFMKAWNYYWYKKKPFHRRLCDSMEDEADVCALFFETLNELGMLDECYPIGKVSD